MDRDTLYLDIDEEITSVVDKLKSAQTNGLDLVIPKEALVLKSVVNLKLLKRQAESLGKEITIVTTDKVGKKLAEQIGIPVVEKPGEAPKEVRMSADEPQMPAGDIEMKDGKPTPVKSDEPGVAADVMAPTAEVVAESSDSFEPVPEKEGGKAKTEKGPKGKRNWKKWGIIGGFAALVIAIAAYILVPLANVEIKLAAEKKKVDFNFTVDKANSAVDTTAQTIPGRQLSEDKDVTNKFTATGKKKVGTKATGTVTIHNHHYSTSDFTMNAGARIVTAGGLVYRTTTNVTVPKFTSPPQVDGTADVSVTADDVGDAYNVAGGTMTVPGLGAPSADIWATSGAAFSGGASHDVQYVTQADVNKAKDDMTKNATGDFQRAIQDKVESSERLLDNSIKIDVKSANPSVAVGGEAAEFELKLTANVKAIVFKEEDLKKLATAVLGDQIGAGKEIVESESLISSTTFTDADHEKGTMHASLSGEAFVATKIDQNKIKTELSGDAEKAANDYLKNIDGVDEVNIKFFPSFYKRMPRITNHIYIKTSLNKVQ